MAILLIGLQAQARPVPVRPVLEIPRTDQTPVIDGRLDDACWATAAVLTNFTQVLPVEGAPPSEQTEVRLLHNEDYLYLGVRCFDRQPDQILVKEMRRDGSMASDDKVQIVIDTFFRQREGYYFVFNPAGAKTDGLIEDFDRQNALWDTIWWVKAHVDERGWSAEVAIPFKSLSFNPKQGSWGFNVERTIRRRQERVRWTGLSRAKPVSSLADFGEVRGLTNLNQGWGLELKPSASVKFLDDNVADDTDWKFKPSLDLTYHITPALKANATINTDFAEAEVDDRVVNLTRFPLFFPEKRDFFLQDSDLFRFGGLSAYPISPYYSRRIGLNAEGEQVDILAGGRLTGRTDGTRLAVLDVQQDDYDEVDSKNLLVGRVSTPLPWGEDADVGGILTYGDPQSNGDAFLGGMDVSYLNNHLPRDKTIGGHGWIMGSSSDRLEAEDYAVGGDLDFPNEPLDIHLYARQIGRDFDPALGFLRRAGIREYQGYFRYIWRPNTDWVRSISLGLYPRFTTDLDNRIVEENHDLPSLWITNPVGDEWSLIYSNERDVLDEPFEIQPGIIIPVDDYRMHQFITRVETSQTRPAGVALSLRAEEFYTGHRQDYFGELQLRPSRHVTTAAGYKLSDIHLDEGSFVVRVATARLDLAVTPDLTWSSLAQYDNLSDNLGLNSRIRWTYRPGNDLFLVANQGFNYDEWRLSRLNSEVTLKVGATFRF